MSAIDYEVEYNNRRRVPEHPEIGARWSAASAAYRACARADLDQAYGPGVRHRYDLFHATDAAAPLVVYIHGGYWQRGDRKDYSFLAAELNRSGLQVAIPSYSLCPAVSVMDIVEELRRCLVALWRKTGRHMTVVGHSAGGHLTAVMLASDWSREAADVPTDLVRAGVAISGVFDLGPLIPTSLNEALGLDADSAHAASPLFWAAPKAGSLVAAVGGGESAEFLRQSRAVAEAWKHAGFTTEYLELPTANHFTVVDELAKPASTLFRRLTSLALGA